MKNNYEVGDTWEGVSGKGTKGKVWLHKIDGNIEIWKWEATYKGGSGLSFDWTTSKRIAIEQCKSNIFSKDSFIPERIIFRKI